MSTIVCPTCRGPSTLDRSNRWKPFCSERCRLIDLGGWLEERYAIPGETAQDELSTDTHTPDQGSRSEPS